MNNKRQPDNVNKAQAENSPELSSILKEMKNGFDIQPLDDIRSAEIIEFEDNVVVTDHSAQESAEKTEHIRSADKKKRSYPKFIRVSIVAALVICVVAAIYISFFHLDDFAYSAVAVYEKQSAVNIVLENDDILKIENVSQIKLSDNGNILTYSQDTDSKTGKYDIRVIDFTKRNSVKNQGSVIVTGIDENWHMDKTGNFIYYTKNEAGSKKYYVYSTQTRETEMVAADATEYFIPPMGDIVYYTRERNGNTMLYRYRFGETVESLGDVNNVKAVSNSEILEIFYTQPDSNYDSPTLYKITGDKQPIKISDNVAEVHLDSYTPGGNLYYFVKNEAKLNWNDFINDSYQDSDATMLKPVRDDYLVTVGFFFKRTKLDEKAYNNAIAQYNQKLLRDEIRLALDKLDLGLAVPAEYKIKVFDGVMSKELASSVKIDNLISFADTGAPRIIYQITGIDSDRMIDMDSIYQIAQAGTVSEAIDDVIEKLSDNYEISKGYKYSRYDGNKVTTYDFSPEGNAYKADYEFLDQNTILTCILSGETVSDLYINTVGDKTIGESVLISDNVISYEIKNGKVYFTKLNENRADLYVFSPDTQATLISENNIQFIVTDQNTVITFNGVYENGDIQQTSIAVYDGKKSKTIDNNISFKHFVIKGEDFAYIRNYKSAANTDTESVSGGELMIYSQGKSVLKDNSVSTVYEIN